MSAQLVLSINSRLDEFRWCWLNEGQVQSPSVGDLEALRTAVGYATQSVWLLLPGAQVVSRELDYSEAEKKHLRKLLPFQLEESVVGDIDELHVALGQVQHGKVALAYTDKEWLRSVFVRLGTLGLEITRCWSAPMLLPLVATSERVEPEINADEGDGAESIVAPRAVWSLALQDDRVDVRLAEQDAFSVPLAQLALSLNLLIAERHLEKHLPSLRLRAADEASLEQLANALPARLTHHIQARELVDHWVLDFDGQAINLCQAEFSQRLPLERWWKLWSNIVVLGLITLVVYLGVQMFQIYKLKAQNLALRQQMESVYRGVVPMGQSDDPERRLRVKLSGLQPKTQSGSVVSMMAAILPLVANNPDITVKLISYSGDTGEMSLNVQAGSFSAIDSLRQKIVAQGYNAELLTANANTGRIKISKPVQP